MGSPAFAIPTLEALRGAGHTIACVYAQPPRPAGRGHREQPAPVHAWASAHGLPVRTPRSLRSIEAETDFADLAVDAAVVAAYGLILPPAVLRAPRLGCFNVHASLLPRWRGAAPIQRAILAGDTQTGITIMQMDEGLDSGPILLARPVPIAAGSTAATLHDSLASLGATLMVEALSGIAVGTLTPVAQPQAGVTYAPKVHRDEGRLEWRQPASDLERLVRAFDPWPGAWFSLDAARIKVVAAEALDAQGTPGCVLDQWLTIACGRGALRPRRLQRPGRAVVDVDAFLRGYPVPAGTMLP